ncbi:MAG: hypothetical protein ABRQ37_08760 [Candidatus Eremiobacterota bacterium]
MFSFFLSSPAKFIEIQKFPDKTTESCNFPYLPHIYYGLFYFFPSFACKIYGKMALIVAEAIRAMKKEMEKE